MPETIAARKARKEHRAAYGRFLAAVANAQPKIDGLDAQIRQLQEEIDAARVRIKGGKLCGKCESYAVVPHEGKAEWVYRGPNERRSERKLTYRCDVCSDVKKVEISRAYTCDTCKNESVVHVSRGVDECQVCNRTYTYDDS